MSRSSRRSGRAVPRRPASNLPRGRGRTPAPRRGGGRGVELLTRVGVAGGIIGGAFALGLLFGEEGGTGSAALEGGLEQIDEITSRYDEVKKELELTFHRELTAAQPRPEGAPAQPLLALQRDAGPTSEPKRAEAAAAEPAAQEARAEDAAEASGDKDPAPEPEPVRAAQAQAEEPAPEPVRPEAASEDDASPAPKGRRRLAAALSSVLGEEAPSWAKEQAEKPAAEPERARPQAQPAPGGAGAYVLQVASFPAEDAAVRLAGRLKSDGHRVRLQSANISSGPVWRVQIVGFSSRATAETARERVRAQHGLNGLVRAGS